MIKTPIDVEEIIRNIILDDPDSKRLFDGLTDMVDELKKLNFWQMLFAGAAFGAILTLIIRMEKRNGNNSGSENNNNNNNND